MGGGTGAAIRRIAGSMEVVNRLGMLSYMKGLAPQTPGQQWRQRAHCIKDDRGCATHNLAEAEAL